MATSLKIVVFCTINCVRLNLRAVVIPTITCIMTARFLPSFLNNFDFQSKLIYFRRLVKYTALYSSASSSFYCNTEICNIISSAKIT